MEDERQPSAAAPATISNVLDDDNLLVEILLRVGFPTTLVCAALVCKRWFHHAFDVGFLRRFRELHPPRLLGFYIYDILSLDNPCFVPMRHQPPELAVVFRRAGFSLDTGEGWPTRTYAIMDCRNGSVFTEHYDGNGYTFRVHNPLCAKRGMETIPTFPCCEYKDGCSPIWHDLLSKEQGDHLSYFYVSIESTEERTRIIAHIYLLQDGVWCTHRTLAMDRPYFLLLESEPVMVDNKIYIAASPRYIMVLDLMVSSFSKICLPQGVEYGDRDTMLSRADDASGVYLIQVKELELRIWVHKWDNWLLVDIVCLREMLCNLRMSDCTVGDEHTDILRIYKVGDNAEFLFFEMGRSVLYLDIKCKTLRKVYEIKKKDGYSSYYICPFKMIWPPIFPALKDDSSRNAFCSC